MPELPEVEVVRRGLQTHVAGRRIERVEVLHPRSVRRHVEGGVDLAGRLAGRTIAAAERRGKFLWLPLTEPGLRDRAIADGVPVDAGKAIADVALADSGEAIAGGVPVDAGEAIVAHLGMSGQMLVNRAGDPDQKHLRIRAALDDGSELRFVDQRTFGGWQVAELVPAGSAGAGGRVVPEPVAHIAPDPFEADYDVEHVARRLRAKRTEVKRALLDQTLVASIGNIYADEALWRARLHWACPTDRLTRAKAIAVLTAARDVMADALEQGGTSFDSLYVNVNGESGMPATERNVPGRSLPLRAPRSPYFGGECLRLLGPPILSLPAKTFVNARNVTGRGHVNICSLRSLRQAAHGLELDRVARMSVPDVVEHRHRGGLRTLRGEVHA